MGHRGHHAAATLADFLRALHRDAPPTARTNPNRGVPLRTLAREFDNKLPAITTAMSAEVRAAWDEAVDAPEWAGPPVWLHGDLHPANVVVAEATSAGVIDFGELCAGDPATDLAAAWLLLPDGAAEPFFDAYSTADRATIRRARGWALLRGLSLIDIGRAWERGLPCGQQTWAPLGRAAIERVLASR
ncbi:phosphotransferase [Nocardia nepalensis]|uniref:phosphotransferase n=1 Tax=Nocardia nepalensis TaxID=3375448 RepID=UPI003B672A9B